MSLIAIHAHGIPHVFPPRRAHGGRGGAARAAGRPRGLAQAAARHHRSGRRQGPRRRGPRRARHRSRTIPAASSSRVAIADVAALRAARLARSTARRCVRGNSVYFPDRVVPMLPERISNDLCSLRPNEDRAALAVRMVIGADGRKRCHTLPPRADALGREAALRAGAGRHRRPARRHHRPAARAGARAALCRLRGAQARARRARSRSTSTCRSARSCSSRDGTRRPRDRRRSASMPIG